MYKTAEKFVAVMKKVVMFIRTITEFSQFQLKGVKGPNN